MHLSTNYALNVCLSKEKKKEILVEVLTAQDWALGRATPYFGDPMAIVDGKVLSIACFSLASTQTVSIVIFEYRIFARASSQL